VLYYLKNLNDMKMYVTYTSLNIVIKFNLDHKMVHAWHPSPCLTDRTKMLPTSKLIKVVVVRINSLQTKRLNINLPESLLLIFFFTYICYVTWLGQDSSLLGAWFQKFVCTKEIRTLYLIRDHICHQVHGLFTTRTNMV
jgi:hypothetical protein